MARPRTAKGNELRSQEPLVEAISRLKMLQREMARDSQQDKNYESKKRALQAAIQEVRKMISTNAP